MAFKVEVPIKVEGSGGKKIGKDIADNIKNSLKSIGMKEKSGGSGGVLSGVGVGKGIGKIAGILGGILAIGSAIYDLIKPVFQMLKVILTLLFLPLIPILKPVLQKLGDFAKEMAGKAKDFLSGDISLSEYLEDFISSAVNMIVDNIPQILSALGKIAEAMATALLRAAFNLGVRIGTWIYEEVIQPAGEYISTKILEAFEWVKSIPTKIWDDILEPAWNWFTGIGQKIWDDILEPAWNWFNDIGQKIWDILKPPFQAVADAIESAVKAIKNLGGSIVDRIKSVFSSEKESNLGGLRRNDFVYRPGQAAVSFSPDDTIIGVKDPSKLMGNNITLNINNPSVRNDMDIKKIANEVSRVFQRQLTGRMSQ